MTPELKRALDDIRQHPAYAFVVHEGITNCRRKNNTANGPWSEHAWSNAVDLMLSTTESVVTGAKKQAGDQLAAYMRSRPDLWSEVFWQVAGHYNHPHGTANPRRNFDNEQVPPCAGGEEEDMPLNDADKQWISEQLEALVQKVWFYPIPDEDDGVGTRGASHALRQAWAFSKLAATRAITAVVNTQQIAEEVVNEFDERLDS